MSVSGNLLNLGAEPWISITVSNILASGNRSHYTYWIDIHKAAGSENTCPLLTFRTKAQQLKAMACLHTHPLLQEQQVEDDMKCKVESLIPLQAHMSAATSAHEEQWDEVEEVEK
ncbi:hypothetical protein NDU88_004141 [Pleurodeles waltl]|uniref:Uncharacterized protein n=1 Tax=Pleurodeles waltl TaxID=8319 RepID=A0AAV7VG77_PLEWA|nr:hypothetical protein NDU88_004141 [Pleurodeles waltl]